MPPLALSLRLKSPSPSGQRLYDLLTAYLQSPAPAPDNIADHVHELAQKPLQAATEDPEAIEGFLGETWAIVISLAKQIPRDHESQDRLVDLIKALTALPPSTVRIWESDTRVWTDLPLLGPSMREAWDPPSFSKSTPPDDAVQEWVNLNSFAARLLALPSVSWSNYAVWSLRDALEEDHSSGPKFDCDVAAAAEWIIHAGPQLAREAAQSEEQTEQRSLRGGALYRGPGKLCPERWGFWKQRFEYIGGLDGGISEKGRRAREVMEKNI